MKPWYLIVLVIIVLAAVLVFARIAARPHPTDEAQILSMLQRGETALVKKDAGGMVSCIAPNYADTNGLKYDTLCYDLIEAARDGGDYTLQTSDPNIKVTGNKATVDFNVSITLKAEDHNRSFVSPITLQVAKETVKKYFVFPHTVWLITSISHLPDGF